MQYLAQSSMMTTHSTSLHYTPSHLSNEEANCLKAALACLVLKRRLCSSDQAENQVNESTQQPYSTCSGSSREITNTLDLSSLILRKPSDNEKKSKKNKVWSREKSKDHIIALIRSAAVMAQKEFKQRSIHTLDGQWHYRNPREVYDLYSCTSNSVNGLCPYISTQIRSLLMSEDCSDAVIENDGVAVESTSSDMMVLELLERSLYPEDRVCNYLFPVLQSRCQVIHLLAKCGLPMITLSATCLICRELHRLLYDDTLTTSSSIDWDWVAVNNLLLLESLVQIWIQQGNDGQELLHILAEECGEMLIPTPLDSLPIIALDDMKIDPFFEKEILGISIGGKLMLRMELLQLMNELALMIGS